MNSYQGTWHLIECARGDRLNWIQGIELQEPGKEKLNWLAGGVVIAGNLHIGARWVWGPGAWGLGANSGFWGSARVEV